MLLKKMLRVTNGRVRLLVGLFLAGMFCIQCTQKTEANRDLQYATAVSGKVYGTNSPQTMNKLETLAKTDHIKLLEMCLQNCSGYRDYTCILSKQERLGGKLGKEQVVDVKFLAKPFSVSMLWTKNRPIADRVLYVEGQRNNQMLVRPAGLLSFVGPQLRKPDDEEAMRNTLRPVSQFGFERNLVSLIEVYQQAKKNGDLKEEFGKYAKVGDRNTLVLVRYLPPKHDYPAQKTLVYIDLEYLVPVMVECYDWEQRLSARYVFNNVKFNTGLTNDDFLPQANGMAEAS